MRVRKASAGNKNTNWHPRWLIYFLLLRQSNCLFICWLLNPCSVIICRLQSRRLQSSFNHNGPVPIQTACPGQSCCLCLPIGIEWKWETRFVAFSPGFLFPYGGIYGAYSLYGSSLGNLSTWHRNLSWRVLTFSTSGAAWVRSVGRAPQFLKK